MEALAQQPYCFGPFLLDPAEKVLFRDEHALSLPPKAIETLLALVERHRLETCRESTWINLALSQFPWSCGTDTVVVHEAVFPARSAPLDLRVYTRPIPEPNRWARSCPAVDAVPVMKP